MNILFSIQSQIASFIIVVVFVNRRLCSVVDPLPVPEAESDKKYPEKISRIVEDISKLTLLETAQLNELLKVYTGSISV